MQDNISTFRWSWSKSSGVTWAPEPATARAGIDTGRDDIFVDDLDAQGAAAFVVPWRDLAARSLEPNAYFEPDFALPAAVGVGKRLRFLFVWQGRRDRLLGVFPIALPQLPLPFAMARLWSHKNSTCAMPLLDPGSAERAWSQIVSHCRHTWPWLAGLSVAGARIGRAAADGTGQAYAPFDRAVLDCSASAKPFQPVGYRTLRKSRRRLERLGNVEFRIEDERERIAAATEAFLALEAKGWKGGRGALASRPHLATFARTALDGLAAQDRCRIAVLALDGAAIAIGIVLVSARRAFFWKIAYDEAYASCSPGALLSVELTQALMADPGIDGADSCADAGHPMIEKLWPGRQRVATVFVGVGSRPAFRIAVVAEIARLEARRHLKTIVHRAGRLRSPCGSRRPR